MEGGRYRGEGGREGKEGGKEVGEGGGMEGGKGWETTDDHYRSNQNISRSKSA